ncbi:hypothetical protein ONZ45_g3859 [Pleurotus djamor]|nr:hypothetical protein ONZ45_g3859 [Pleurotus djamor]
MPFGEIDSVGDFVFCQDHGFEICGRCCTDLRICNNPRVEEYLDTLNFEDGSFEQAEAYEIALADDRPTIQARQHGAPSGRRDQDGGNIYRCFEHSKNDCSSCFHFAPKVLQLLGVAEPTPRPSNQAETATDNGVSYTGFAVEAGEPSRTFRASKENRRNWCRPSKNPPGPIPVLSHSSCPRRFLPPRPDTKPMDIFVEKYDRGMTTFKRFIHRQDDTTALFFVDGACLDQGNPQHRRAGCGIVWNDERNGGYSHSLEGTLGGPEQTSNRAELRAVILWIQYRVWETGGFDRMVVATDSEYVVEGICERIPKWIKKGWKTSAGTPVAHRDLWEILLAELADMDRAECEVLFWRIPRAFNVKADARAKEAAKRLKRIGHSTAYLEDSIGKSVVSTEEIADISEDEEDDPTHKSDAGNREPKARFGRRRTHNEQLVVACCGVVTGRVTMYGAEAISGVKDVLKSIYQTREDLPTVIFYDNNCHLQAHLLKQGDTYFQNTILPVDVFHFKSKHKKTDEFCQRHCNPAQWKELVDVKTNKWRFNSSIAEQVNVWMGGYMAVVREMLPYHFDFFLDEMIKRRNQIIVRKLKTQGSIPYRIPPHRREG